MDLLKLLRRGGSVKPPSKSVTLYVDPEIPYPAIGFWAVDQHAVAACRILADAPASLHPERLSPVLSVGGQFHNCCTLLEALKQGHIPYRPLDEDTCRVLGLPEILITEEPVRLP